MMSLFEVAKFHATHSCFLKLSKMESKLVAILECHWEVSQKCLLGFNAQEILIGFLQKSDEILKMLNILNLPVPISKVHGDSLA